MKHRYFNPENQDKMKNQLSNIALEGTCSSDVVGGLLSWTLESLQALLFFKRRNHRPEPSFKN